MTQRKKKDRDSKKVVTRQAYIKPGIENEENIQTFSLTCGYWGRQDGAPSCYHGRQTT